MERKVTRTLLNSIFIFGVYNYFAEECFSEPVEVTMLPGQGIIGILGIILANCGLSVFGV